MHQMGSPSLYIEVLLADIKASKDINALIKDSILPMKVKRFLEFTFDIVLNAPLHDFHAANILLHSNQFWKDLR